MPGENKKVRLKAEDGWMDGRRDGRTDGGREGRVVIWLPLAHLNKHRLLIAALCAAPLPHSSPRGSHSIAVVITKGTMPKRGCRGYRVDLLSTLVFCILDMLIDTFLFQFYS